MKSSTSISISALIFSIIALVLSINTARQSHVEYFDRWGQEDLEDENDWRDEDIEVVETASDQYIRVKATYKLEDRYTIGTIPNPILEAAMDGTVVVGITVDWLGHVTKTTVDPCSTIHDETIVEECRRSALKTTFNSKSSTVAGGSQKGSITFNFVME